MVQLDICLCRNALDPIATKQVQQWCVMRILLQVLVGPFACVFLSYYSPFYNLVFTNYHFRLSNT